ncbi:MAG: hypothetical protein JKX71_06045 [Amylibacter sp.]|nr:hypothetical protein [Amylibacter sp.]
MASDLLPKIVAQLLARTKSTSDLSNEQIARILQREKVLEMQAVKDKLEEQEALNWEHFCGLAANWKTADHLSEFLSKIKSKMLTGNYELDGLPLADWVELAEVRIEQLNPFNRIKPAVDDAKDRDKD